MDKDKEEDIPPIPDKLENLDEKQFERLAILFPNTSIDEIQNWLDFMKGKI